MKYQEQPGYRRGMGHHGIEDTKEPQIPSFEDFFHLLGALLQNCNI